MASPQLVLAGTNYDATTAAKSGSASAWTVATYYALPPLGNPPLEGPAEYDERVIGFTGIDGLGTKNLGFRGRDIDLEMIFLATTKANAETAKNALFTALRAARFSVTLPGGTARPSCRLKKEGFKQLREFALGGRTAIHCSVNIRQLNLT